MGTVSKSPSFQTTPFFISSQNGRLSSWEGQVSEIREPTSFREFRVQHHGQRTRCVPQAGLRLTVLLAEITGLQRHVMASTAPPFHGTQCWFSVQKLSN